MPPRFEDFYEGKPIPYAIHRDRVLACDPTNFINSFDIDRIATAGKLGCLRGALHITFNGWIEDPRAIHEIPEIRGYVQELDRQYPHLLYVTSHATEALRLMCLCLVPQSFTHSSARDPERFAAIYDNRTYHEILQRWFTDFDSLCARARCFTRRQHAEMTVSLAQYFDVSWEEKH